MHKKAHLMSVAILLLAASLTHAIGTIDSPECVSFDTLHNRYLVSSWSTGQIVALLPTGETSVLWQGSQRILGNTIYRDTLYVSMGASGGSIVGVDLATGDQVMQVTLPESTQPDGLVGDSSGNLWVVDSRANVLFRLRLSDRNVTKFSIAGLVPTAQDIHFDSAMNRLIIGAWYNVAIQSYDINSGVLTDIITPPFGYIDGIARDQDGNYYFSDYNANKVYMYDSLFGGPPMVVVSGVTTPSNIGYNWRDSLLIVPSFSGDSVHLVHFSYYQDQDRDTVPAYRDNCPGVANTDQMDQDHDGTGDACDECPLDSLNDADGDSFCADLDNCPAITNPGQEDLDGDHIGDVCDACPNDTLNDPDGDAICGGVDNCPGAANPSQEDANHDGIGDACCCLGVRGNVNYSGIVDLADLSALVSYLTGGGYALPCPNEANINGAGIVDLADLSALVSYLTGGGYALPNCL